MWIRTFQTFSTRIVLFTLALALLGAKTQAGSISYDIPFIDFPTASANPGMTMFDPSLGNLDSIVFTLAGSVHSGTIGFHSDFDNPVTFTLNAGVYVRPIIDSVPSISLHWNASEVKPANGGGTIYPSFTSAFESTSSTLSDPLILAKFIGPGIILADFIANESLDHSGSNGFAYLFAVHPGINEGLNGTYTYTYNYTNPQTVPEPATLSLLCVGFAGLMVNAIRRRRQPNMVL